MNKTKPKKHSVVNKKIDEEVWMIEKVYIPGIFKNDMTPEHFLNALKNSLKSIAEVAKEEERKNMQEIVQDYFKNILKLPCPDFTFNAEQNERSKNE